MIPLLYPLGLKGVKTKVEAIFKAIKRESIWMFFSIALLLYFFGYISYNIFWKCQKYFKTPIHASISLLQVSTFDGIGQITTSTEAVSGLAVSFGILITTTAIFQILYNINQALIIQYAHEKTTSYSMNRLFLSLLSTYGISLNVDGMLAFRIINLISTAGVFFVPFQSHLVWLYCLLSSVSTLSIVLYELAKGNIFGYRSMFNVAL